MVSSPPEVRLAAADAAISQLLHFFKPCGWDTHLQRFEPDDPNPCKHPECTAVRYYFTLKG